MRKKTVIYLRWKISGRVEIYTNLGKLYKNYGSESLGISRFSLDRKDLFIGWESDLIEIKKINLD
jgi:hypothetical protein